MRAEVQRPTLQMFSHQSSPTSEIWQATNRFFGLNSPATFGNNKGEGLRQIVADLFKDPVDAVRIGVVQEVGFHFISACAECIRDELRAQGRAADADAQYPGEAVSFFGFDLS